MQPASACEIRGEMMDRHRVAMKEYRTAVALMDDALGHPEFKEATEHADIARIRYCEIRDELHKHLDVHGC